MSYAPSTMSKNVFHALSRSAVSPPFKFDMTIPGTAERAALLFWPACMPTTP